MSEELPMLNASDVNSWPKGARGSRTDKRCELHKNRRWSPYSKRRKLLPKKSFSLENITIHHQLERSQSFELTQSTKDRMSLGSEPNLDDTVDTPQDWMLSTIDQFARPSLHRPIDSELTFPPGIQLVNALQPTNEPSNQTVETGNQTGKPLAEWLLWCAYSKLMKLAWRKSRKNLNEQTHKAQNCELQAKSTMSQVYTMKVQLKSDVNEMKDRVKKIQSARVMLESAEIDKNVLKSEAESFKAKIACLKEDQVRMKEEISNLDQAVEDYVTRAESLKEQLKACDEELVDLKAEKEVVDSEIQELMSLAEQTKEKVTTGRKNIYNRELEIADIERELAAVKDKADFETRMVHTVKEQALLISKDIETAREGEKALQEELAEARERLMERDAQVAELSAKVASAAEQIVAIKSGEEATGKSWWRRFRILSKDTRSLFSIQL